MIRIGFHDSTLSKLYQSGEDLQLVMDRVYITHEDQSCEIVVRNIQKILIDGTEVEKIDMPAEDGEILDLEIERQALFALVEWRNFKENTTVTHSYKFLGKTIQISIPLGNLK